METSDGNIMLKLNGPTNSIDLKTLATAIDELAQLVGALPSQEDAVKLGGLMTGSAKIAVDTTRAVACEMEDGLDQLRQTRRRPNGWTLRQLQALRKIIEAGKKGDGAELSVNGTRTQVYPLDTDLREAIKEAIERSRISIGSVRGVIDRYNGHSRTRSAKLVQELTGKTITLKFKEEMTGSIFDAMHNRVEVRGLLTRNPETNQVEEADVRGIRILPAEKISGQGIWRGMDLGEDGDIEAMIRRARA